MKLWLWLWLEVEAVEKVKCTAVFVKSCLKVSFCCIKPLLESLHCASVFNGHKSGVDY